MLSVREIRRNRTKKQLLTTGGSSSYYLNSGDFNALIKLFFQASTQQQFKLLLKSLLTNRELVDITRRMIVGRMLLEGLTYQEIRKKNKSMPTTISLIKKNMLMDGEILKSLIEQTYNLTAADKYIKRRLKKGK